MKIDVALCKLLIDRRNYKDFDNKFGIVRILEINWILLEFQLHVENNREFRAC